MTEGLLLLANAEAGSHEDEAVEAARSRLAEEAGVEVALTSGVEELDDVLAGLDGRHLVVAGGDGSLHVVVARLRAHDLLPGTVVGLVPLGTGNDFARGLELPTDPVEAAEHLLRTPPRRLDLLLTDHDDVVVNASHAGLGAYAAIHGEGLKDKFGNAAYPIGALIAGVREGGADLTVTVDGEVLHQGQTLMVGVANGPSIGGGTRLAPPANPADGLLDVVVVSAVGRAARIAFGAALKRGTHLERDDVVNARAREVTIAGDEVPHDLDGEITEPRASCTYRVQPGAWSFRG